MYVHQSGPVFRSKGSAWGFGLGLAVFAAFLLTKR